MSRKTTQPRSRSAPQGRGVPLPLAPPKKHWRLWFNIGAVVLLFAALGVIAVISVSQDAPGYRPISSPAATGAPALSAESRKGESIDALHELLALKPEDLAGVDIARMNLLCAQGLPGAEGLDIAAELATLDRWAQLVKVETDRHLYKFRQKPADYENSEGYYRILMLITVLQQDFGVRYNPERIYTPDFTDSRDVFMHGLTKASTVGDHAGGTCVSMPVLYTAVGRRLGYPVRLVTTKEHVFSRWEDATERFNIEATSQGLSVYPDEHYKTWPYTLTRAEIESGSYLRSLTPAQELGLFMAARGYVLQDTGRKHEATVAYAYAHLLDPASIDSFDNLGRSVFRQLPDYPAVHGRQGTPVRFGPQAGRAAGGWGDPEDLLPPERIPGRSR